MSNLAILIYLDGGGVKFIKHFKGGARCESLGTSCLYSYTSNTVF
jgi:hypothetical protein